MSDANEEQGVNSPGGRGVGVCVSVTEVQCDFKAGEGSQECSECDKQVHRGTCAWGGGGREGG